MDNTFTCSMCKGTFKKGWSDEEAIAEAKEVFGQDPNKDEMGLVCDECYNLAMTTPVASKDSNYFEFVSEERGHSMTMTTYKFTREGADALAKALVFGKKLEQ